MLGAVSCSVLRPYLLLVASSVSSTTGIKLLLNLEEHDLIKMFELTRSLQDHSVQCLVSFLWKSLLPVQSYVYQSSGCQRCIVANSQSSQEARCFCSLEVTKQNDLKINYTWSSLPSKTYRCSWFGKSYWTSKRKKYPHW